MFAFPDPTLPPKNKKERKKAKGGERKHKDVGEKCWAGGMSCNFPGDGAGGVFGPTGPSCPLHQGNRGGGSQNRGRREKTPWSGRERLRQRTECREPGGYGIVHLVKNREAPFKCGLAERTPGGSLLERAPG